MAVRSGAVMAQRGFVFVVDAPDATIVIKRALDITIAAVLLALCGPLLLVLAVAVKLDTPGPVLLRQERAGRDLRVFGMYKLRSMTSDAEQRRQEVAHLNDADGPLFKIRRDPRITRVGRFLRRLSLDELPQLVNVLRGEMSLVGPRPPFVYEVSQDYLRQRLRLRVTPGLTGLWQVRGRSDLGYEDMIALDFSYCRGWSLALDLKILVLTIPAVLAGKGAC